MNLQTLKKLLILALLAALLYLGASYACTRITRNCYDPGVGLDTIIHGVICTDRTRYVLSNPPPPVHVTFTVCNVSEEPVVFVPKDGKPAIEILAQLPSGDQLWSESEVGEKLERLELAPGESYVIEWTLHLEHAPPVGGTRFIGTWANQFGEHSMVSVGISWGGDY